MEILLKLSSHIIFSIFTVKRKLSLGGRKRYVPSYNVQV